MGKLRVLKDESTPESEEIDSWKTLNGEVKAEADGFFGGLPESHFSHETPLLEKCICGSNNH